MGLNRVEEVAEGDQRRHARFRHRIERPPGVGEIGSQRLLAVHVLSAAGRRHRHVHVDVVRGRDGHHVDAGIIDQRLPVRRPHRDLEPRGQLLGGERVTVGDGNQSWEHCVLVGEHLQLAQRGGMHHSHETGAQYRHARLASSRTSHNRSSIALRLHWPYRSQR